MKNDFFKNFLLLVAAIFSIARSQSQCTRIPPAANACPIISGTAIIADGTTNNNVHGSGAVFYYNGSGGTAKISMTNDGILAVCGSLTTTASSTFNLSSGGTIQVESGGSLTINSNITLNNTGQIVNRGTLIINGNISLTNNNATIWNLPPADMFLVGAGKNVTLNAGYFIDHEPSYAVTIPTLNLSGGFLCMGNSAIVNTQVFTSSTDNSVLYSGTVYPACLYVGNSAQVGGVSVANSSSIDVSLAPGFSYTSGSVANWGSATVVANSGGCYIVLPLKIIHVTAVEEAGKTAVKWNTAGNAIAGEVFEVERSEDGNNFHVLSVVVAKQNMNEYKVYDPVAAPKRFYRIRLSSQTSAAVYSSVVTISKEIENEPIIFPNPVVRGEMVTISIHSQTVQSIKLSLIDQSGKTVVKKTAAVITGNNQLKFDLNGAKPGVYLLKIFSGDNSLASSTILVRSL